MTLSSYNDIFKTDFGGKLPTATVQGAPSYNLNTDVGQGMLGMTLGAGHAGADLTGTQAFLGAWNPGNDTKQDALGKYTYDTSTLGGLAGSLGIDTSKYNLGTDVSDTDYYKLSNDLNDQLKNYHYISGLSQGWNPNQDSRGADRTLYLDDGTGNLNPVTTPVDYHAKEAGNWFQENPDFVMAASIIGGGILGGTALAGLGATGATGAGIGGATTAASTGAGTAGLSGSVANAIGLGSQWGALPAWGQGAITGALQGGVTSGLQGGNIGRGILMGGLSGGVGGWAGPALSSATGLPSWASNAAVSAGMGGLTGGWQGALGAGLGSLANTGLQGAGIPSGLSSLVSKYGTGAVLSGLSGGSAQPGGGGATGLSGGDQGGSGGSGSQSLLQSPRLGAAAAQQAAFLRDSYAPVAQEAAKKKQAQSLLDELENA